MNLIDELLGLVAEFEVEQIDYAVWGGLALAAHGHARFTKDIDLLALEEQLDRVRAVARRRGFTLEGGRMTFGSGTERERSLYRVSKAKGANVITLDLLLVGPIHDATWKESVRVSWRGRTLWLVSRGGLIRMKRDAGRPQDLLDIQTLERETGAGPNG